MAPREELDVLRGRRLREQGEWEEVGLERAEDQMMRVSSWLLHLQVTVPWLLPT